MQQRAFHSVWNAITHAQQCMLAGLLLTLVDPEADTVARTNILVGFPRYLVYDDAATGHSSNVSHLLEILADLSEDGVNAMLVLTGIPEIVIGIRGHDSASSMSDTYESGNTDERPRNIADVPYRA